MANIIEGEVLGKRENGRPKKPYIENENIVYRSVRTMKGAALGIREL